MKWPKSRNVAGIVAEGNLELRRALDAIEGEHNRSILAPTVVW